MKEVIAVTVLVEIVHDGKNRADAVQEAMRNLTRPRRGDFWSWSLMDKCEVLRSRAVSARRTNRKIGRSK